MSRIFFVFAFKIPAGLLPFMNRFIQPYPEASERVDFPPPTCRDACWSDTSYGRISRLRRSMISFSSLAFSNSLTRFACCSARGSFVL